MKKLSVLFLIICIFVCSNLVNVSAKYYPWNNKEIECGTNNPKDVIVSMDEDTLIFKGNGEMSVISWLNYYEDIVNHITTIIICEGITNIPSFMFVNFKYLENIYIPSTMKKIESNCFSVYGDTAPVKYIDRDPYREEELPILNINFASNTGDYQKISCGSQENNLYTFNDWIKVHHRLGWLNINFEVENPIEKIVPQEETYHYDIFGSFILVGGIVVCLGMVTSVVFLIIKNPKEKIF